ncbi:MAG: Gldg family protein [Eubacteriales bacterium]|nr:Gldg family protein [Eubacteriales bacterium]
MKRFSTLLISLIIIAAIILVNTFLNIFSDSFSPQLDLTSNNLYELTDDTLEHLDKLDKDVTVYVLSDEVSIESGGEYNVQVNKLLRQFEKNSSHIELEYIDMVTNPTFTASYTDVDWANNSYIMLVECGDEYLPIAAEDVFIYNQDYLTYYGQYVAEGQQLEQALLTAIFNVIVEEKITVTMLTGFGEQDSSAFSALLTNNAYSVETVNPLTGKISEDSQFVVLYAPMYDLDNDTYELLVDWLYNDGNYGHTFLYVPYDGLDTNTPNIDSLLEEWSMGIYDNYIYETDVEYMTNSAYGNIITCYDYDETEFSGKLKDQSIPVVMGFTMPIEIYDSGASALLSSSDSAVLRPIDATEEWDPDDTEKQNLVGAAIATQGNEDESKSSNVIVVGSYDAFNAPSLSQPNYNNAAYFVNIFNAIADRDDISVVIEGKSIDYGTLGVSTSPATVSFLGILFVFIIPISIVAIAIVVFVIRRHK